MKFHLNQTLRRSLLIYKDKATMKIDKIPRGGKNTEPCYPGVAFATPRPPMAKGLQGTPSCRRPMQEVGFIHLQPQFTYIHSDARLGMFESRDQGTLKRLKENTVFEYCFGFSEAVVISKNFNKRGALGATTPHSGCGLATATPTFSKLRYDNLV